MAHPATAVFEYQMTAYRRTWRGSAFSSFLLPVLYVLGIGVGVGRFVDAGGGLAVPYLDYIVPGLLASAALQVAFGESSWPVLSGFKWVRTYDAMRASPLRIVDILAGQWLFVLVRVVTTSAVFLAVVAVAGTLHSPWALATLPISALLGLSTAAPVFAFSARIESDSYFALLQRFVVIPMTLFAGVFFPVEQLPAVLRPLAYVSPLWHGVELCRMATLGTGTALAAAGHVAYLSLWCAVGFVLARAAFRRRLAV